MSEILRRLTNARCAASGSRPFPPNAAPYEFPDRVSGGDWSTQLDYLATKLAPLEPVWPLVHFRVVSLSGQERKIDSPQPVIWAYFELGWGLAPTPARDLSTMPHVQHGSLPMADFANILRSWASTATRSARPRGWAPPVGIRSLGVMGPWSAADTQRLTRLIGDKPATDIPFLVERFQGSGDEIDGANYNRLVGAMQKISGNQPKWQHDYLHESVVNAQQTGMVIQVPWPFYFVIGPDEKDMGLTVEVGYRSPATDSEMHVYVGQGAWGVNGREAGLVGRDVGGDGWLLARFQTEFDGPGDYTTWVDVGGGQDFDYEYRFTVSDSKDNARPLEIAIGHSVDTWLGLTNRKGIVTLAEGLRSRTANPPPGKQTGDGRVFELALHLACSAAGLPNFFGGSVVTTPGVDILVFDREARHTIAISVVTDAKLSEKARQWKAVESQIRSVLEPGWIVRPVIVTSQLRAEGATFERQAAEQEGIRVLTSEDLDCLRSVPPDVRAFRALLNSDPPPR